MKVKLLSKALAPIIARISQWLVGSLVTLLAVNATPEQIVSLEQAIGVILLFAADFVGSFWGSS